MGVAVNFAMDLSWPPPDPLQGHNEETWTFHSRSPKLPFLTTGQRPAELPPKVLGAYHSPPSMRSATHEASRNMAGNAINQSLDRGRNNEDWRRFSGQWLRKPRLTEEIRLLIEKQTFIMLVSVCPNDTLASAASSNFRG